ncbi:MAG: hypothetical protein LCH52_08345 [Bacteroidetes bacterium]|nr:hypothetical protein [Bacteroidota bacterium]
MEDQILLYVLPNFETGGYNSAYTDGLSIYIYDDQNGLIEERPLNNVLRKGINTKFGKIHTYTADTVYFENGNRAGRKILSQYFVKSLQYENNSQADLKKGFGFKIPKLFGKKPQSTAQKPSIDSQTVINNPPVENKPTEAPKASIKGQERPGHKYIRRQADPKNPGKYLYFYQEDIDAENRQNKYFDEDHKEVKSPVYDSKFHDNQYKNREGWNPKEEKFGEKLDRILFKQGKNYEYDLGEGRKLVAKHNQTQPEDIRYFDSENEENFITDSDYAVENAEKDVNWMQTPEEILLNQINDKHGKQKGLLVYNKATKRHRFVHGDDDPKTEAGQWALKSYDYYNSRKPGVANSKSSQEEPDLFSDISEPVISNQNESKTKGKGLTIDESIDTIQANTHRIGDRIEVGGKSGVIEDMTGKIAILKDPSGKRHLVKIIGNQDTNKLYPENKKTYTPEAYKNWQQQQELKRKELSFKLKQSMKEENARKIAGEREMKRAKLEAERQVKNQQREAEKQTKVQEKAEQKKRKELGVLISRFEEEGLPVPEALERYRTTTDPARSMVDLLNSIEGLTEEQKQQALNLSGKQPEQVQARETSSPGSTRSRRTKKQKISEAERQRLLAEQDAHLTEQRAKSAKIQATPEYQKFKSLAESEGFKINLNPYIAVKTANVESFEFEFTREYDINSGVWKNRIANGPYREVQIEDGLSYPIDDIRDNKVYFTQTIDDPFNGIQTVSSSVPIEDLKKRNGSRIFEKTQDSKGIVSNRPMSVVLFSDNIKEYGQWEIVELEDVIASHDLSGAKNPSYTIVGAQNRNRSGSEDGKNITHSQANILNRALNMDFDFLSPSHMTAWDGAPIVDPDYEVIGGNGRYLSIAMHAIEQNRNEYKEGLKKSADFLGFNPDEIDKMKHPIAVRRLFVDKQRAEYLGPKSNQPKTEAETPEEEAIRYASTTPAETKKLVSSNLKGTVLRLSEKLKNAKSDRERDELMPTTRNILSSPAGYEIISRLLKDGVIQQEQLANFYNTKTKTLNRDHKGRVENILTHMYLPKIRHSWADLPDAVQEGITPAIAALFSIEDTKYSLSEDLGEALKLVSDYQINKANGSQDHPLTYARMKESGDIFEQTEGTSLDPNVRNLFLSIADDTATGIKSKLMNYAGAVNQLEEEGESILGMESTGDKNSIISDIFEIPDYES